MVQNALVPFWPADANVVGAVEVTPMAIVAFLELWVQKSG
jgi:hypothetical protein